MVRAAHLIAALALLAPGAVSAQQAPIAGVPVVRDGDTLRIGSTDIRLWGVDAPECRRYCADGSNPYVDATIALRTHIAGRSVHCIPAYRDRYDRQVSRCTVNGGDLSEWMTAQGWARDWPRYSGGMFADAERRARSARRGLWARDCPELWRGRNYGG